MSDFTLALMEQARSLRETNPGPKPPEIRAECVTVRRQGQVPVHLGRMSKDEEENYRAHWLAYGRLPINGMTYAAVLADGGSVRYELRGVMTFRDAFLEGRARVAKR